MLRRVFWDSKSCSRDFMLASLGKPVVVIGSDSRARMIDLLGLAHIL